MLIAAVAAVAAAAAVSIVALAFAIFALLQPSLGQPGAAAAVAVIFAVVVGLVGLIMAGRARRTDRVTERESVGLTERVMDLIRDKPFAAAGVATAVGLMIVRNPRMLGAILSAFLEGWKAPDRRR